MKRTRTFKFYVCLDFRRHLTQNLSKLTKEDILRGKVCVIVLALLLFLLVFVEFLLVYSRSLQALLLILLNDPLREVSLPLFNMRLIDVGT